ETITVVSADSPALDLARIDIGHTLTSDEVHNLPLVARNPYNFALAQPGVTGIGNVEFGVPRLAANGAAMRINYQIDGNTNTEKDRAGLRLLPMSEVMIQEVKVVTTGFAPEFGQTMGMVFNAVTPSGTNTFHGQGSYLFRRKSFSAFPFFFGCGSTTIAAKFFIAKGDYQLNASNRATVRWLRFHNDAPYNSGGGTASGTPLSLERATDFLDAMDSVAGQLNSSFGASMLNEFRTQYAHRHQQSVANADSGTGPAVTITGIAGFGGPLAGTGQGNAGFDFKQNISQVIDNFTLIRGAHSYKAGFDWQHIYDARTSAPQWVYNFSSVAAYLAAKNGTNPRGYSTMTQLTGNLSFDMATNLYSLFVQDDWQLAPTVKLLYGLRYDL